MASQSVADTFSQQSDDGDLKHVLIAPSDCFVEEVFVHESVAKVGDPLLRFDAFEFRRSLFKVESQLVHQALLGQRLAPEYLKKFVREPLEAERDAASSDIGVWIDALKIANDRFRVGEVERAGNLSSPIHIEKELIEARIALEQRLDTIAQKEIEITENIAVWNAEQENLIKNRDLLHQLTEGCLISAPISGTVHVKTFSGAFVTKNTILIELG